MLTTRSFVCNASFLHQLTGLILNPQIKREGLRHGFPGTLLLKTLIAAASRAHPQRTELKTSASMQRGMLKMSYG